MKLAVSNIAWAAEQDEAVYEKMRELGFTGLEIAPTRIFPEQPYAHREEACAWGTRMRRQYGLEIPSMQSIWYGRTERIFGTQEERRELLKYTKQAILFAADIGCKNLVFGCPRNRTLPENVDAETAIPFFQEIGAYASAHGTTIGLEANPSIYHTNFLNTTEQALEWIERTGSPGLQLNLDVGTMLYGNESADLLVGRVGMVSHVHISEPMLAPVQPRALHWELKEILLRENFTGVVSIEMGQCRNNGQLFEVMNYIAKLFK